MRYRKKPVVIEAVQWDGDRFVLPDNYTTAPEWLALAIKKEPFDVGSIKRIGAYLSVHTLEGTQMANPGDWIIQGSADEIYPCKPDIFAAIYDPAEETAA